MAEAVLTASHWALPDDFLQELFAAHRGACYERLLTFSQVVHLTADALLQHHGSGRQAFDHHRQEGQMPVSDQAGYQKLSRLPLPLSEAFLGNATARLGQLFPTALVSAWPASLDAFELAIVDGKAIKKVAKRLKPARGLAGGILGGKALCCLNARTGLVIAAATHADGEVNDARLVPALVPTVRTHLAGPRLWVADRQFCDLTQTVLFTQENDHFLIRYQRKTKFYADPEKPSRSGQDAQGRVWREEWGWLGRPAATGRRYVRRITLERPGAEDLVLVTSLLEGDQYPASDLLELYRRRWRIEQVFQQLVEVFHLEALIGTTPEGTVFQMCFCLWLYNLLQVVRAYVAQGQKMAAERVSVEMLFTDVQKQLVALHELVDLGTVVALVEPLPNAAAVRAKLEQLLHGQWAPLWAKATQKKRRPHPNQTGKREHNSMARILATHRQQIKTDKPSG